MSAQNTPLITSLVGSIASATLANAEIQVGLDFVVSALRRIHGGEWNVAVNHERMTVMIWHNGSDERVSPKREAN